MVTTLKNYFLAITAIFILLGGFFIPEMNSELSSNTTFTNSFNPNQENGTDYSFPFVGQKTTYHIVQRTADLVAATGTLTVEYNKMYDENTITGDLYVELQSIIQYYNESADGWENLENRNLEIDASNTYLINLFMVYFFEWSEWTPTPLWIFPSEIAAGEVVQFWNYTLKCEKSESIGIMDKDYEIFAYKAENDTYLDLTLMYGYASADRNSEKYGLLFYMSASFYEPTINDYLTATFILQETNAVLYPLRVLNRNVILWSTISFYTTVIIVVIIYRLKTRRELVGGEV
jgi:hypothetical protein